MDARKFALTQHGDQTWGPNTPYIVHLDRVASFFRPGTELWKIAYLHDVLEDTDAKYDEIVTHFGIRVAKAVQRLSKYEGINIFDYYQAIYRDPDARPIKMVDNMVNLSHCIINLNTLPSNNGWGRETERKIKDYARYFHYLMTGVWLCIDQDLPPARFAVQKYLMKPGWENFTSNNVE